MPKEFKSRVCPITGEDVLTEVMPAGARNTFYKCSIYHNDGICPVDESVCRLLSSVDPKLFKELSIAEQRHCVTMTSTENSNEAIKRLEQNLDTYDVKSFGFAVRTIEKYRGNFVIISDLVEQLWCLVHNIEIRTK